MSGNECNMCGHDNPKDNFRCEAEDCGVPLDLQITTNDWGLPEIKINTDLKLQYGKL